MQPPDDCPPDADDRARPTDELPERRLVRQALDGCPHTQARPPGKPPDLRLICEAYDVRPPDVDTMARPPGKPPDLSVKFIVPFQSEIVTSEQWVKADCCPSMKLKFSLKRWESCYDYEFVTGGVLDIPAPFSWFRNVLSERRSLQQDPLLSAFSFIGGAVFYDLFR